MSEDHHPTSTNPLSSSLDAARAADGLELIKAFCSISDEKIKAALLDFVTSVAAEACRETEHDRRSTFGDKLSVTLIAERRSGVVCRCHTAAER